MAVGVLAVVTGAYLAAVWLAADAARAGQRTSPRRSACARWPAGVAGAVSLGGLVVLRSDAERIYDGLTSGAGWPRCSPRSPRGRRRCCSSCAGAGARALVGSGRGRHDRRRLGARPAAGVAPGLTVEEAAAGDATLVALLVSIAIGAVILIPSLVLLFGLVLRGRFDESVAAEVPVAAGPPAPGPAPAAGVTAAVCAVVGVPLMMLSDGGVVLALGVIALLVAVAAAIVFVVPQIALADADDGG